MQTKQYDLSSLNEFLNKVIPPCELCEQLIDIMFNYSFCVDDDTLPRFKDDASTIYLLIGEFRKLANQD